jgi:hypothetical protein
MLSVPRQSSHASLKQGPLARADQLYKLRDCKTCARLRGAGKPRNGEPIVDDSRKQQAGRYRTRAEQIRTTAEVMTHHDSRIALLKLAESYDRLAFRIEHEHPLPEA